MKNIYSIGALAAALLFTATAHAKLNVVATLPDYGSIAQTIGGDKVKVTSIAKGTEDQHFVDARPSFVRILNQADVLIEGGAELEIGWLPPLVAGARNGKILGDAPGHLILSRNIRLLEVPTSAVDRSMGDVHPFGNPHFTLDPANGKMIAANIAETLGKVDSANAAFYKSNAEAFGKKLDAKLAEWEKLMKPFHGTKVLTYHKSFNYLLERFGLELAGTIEPKPGIEPSPTHISALIPRAKEQGVKLVLVEAFRPRKTPDYVAKAIGAKLLALPASVDASEKVKDYIELFDYDVAQIVEALKKVNATGDAILTLERLAVGYDRQPVLENINLKVARGGFSGLLGANGSGKSTLIKTILEIIPPVAGQVLFSSINGNPAVLGYVPQRETLDPIYLLSSYEVVLMGVCGRVGPGRFIGKSERDWARDCLKQTGAEQLSRKQYSQLSGGQKQRVLIARALATKPDFLLLDEPTSGIDVTVKQAIMELLRTIHAERKLTILMASHDLPVVRQYTERVVWLHEGKILEGSVGEMLSREKMEAILDLEMH